MVIRMNICAKARPMIGSRMVSMDKPRMTRMEMSLYMDTIVVLMGVPVVVVAILMKSLIRIRDTFSSISVSQLRGFSIFCRPKEQGK